VDATFSESEEADMKDTEENDSVKTGLNQIAQESFYTRRQLNKTMRSINIKLTVILLLMTVYLLKSADFSPELTATIKIWNQLKGIYFVSK
jgi:hypothetical protein